MANDSSPTQSKGNFAAAESRLALVSAHVKSEGDQSNCSLDMQTFCHALVRQMLVSCAMNKHRQYGDIGKCRFIPGLWKARQLQTIWKARCAQLAADAWCKPEVSVLQSRLDYALHALRIWLFAPTKQDRYRAPWNHECTEACKARQHRRAVGMDDYEPTCSICRTRDTLEANAIMVSEQYSANDVVHEQLACLLQAARLPKPGDAICKDRVIPLVPMQAIEKKDVCVCVVNAQFASSEELYGCTLALTSTLHELRRIEACVAKHVEVHASAQLYDQEKEASAYVSQAAQLALVGKKEHLQELCMGMAVHAQLLNVDASLHSATWIVLRAVIWFDIEDIHAHKLHEYLHLNVRQRLLHLFSCWLLGSVSDEEFVTSMSVKNIWTDLRCKYSPSNIESCQKQLQATMERIWNQKKHPMKSWVKKWHLASKPQTHSRGDLLQACKVLSQRFFNIGCLHQCNEALAAQTVKLEVMSIAVYMKPNDIFYGATALLLSKENIKQRLQAPTIFPALYTRYQKNTNVDASSMRIQHQVWYRQAEYLLVLTAHSNPSPKYEKDVLHDTKFANWQKSGKWLGIRMRYMQRACETIKPVTEKSILQVTQYTLPTERDAFEDATQQLDTMLSELSNAQNYKDTRTTCQLEQLEWQCESNFYRKIEKALSNVRVACSQQVMGCKVVLPFEVLFSDCQTVAEVATHPIPNNLRACLWQACKDCQMQGRLEVFVQVKTDMYKSWTQAQRQSFLHAIYDRLLQARCWLQPQGQPDRCFEGVKLVLRSECSIQSLLQYNLILKQLTFDVIKQNGMPVSHRYYFEKRSASAHVVENVTQVGEVMRQHPDQVTSQKITQWIPHRNVGMRPLVYQQLCALGIWENAAALFHMCKDCKACKAKQQGCRTTKTMQTKPNTPTLCQLISEIARGVVYSYWQNVRPNCIQAKLSQTHVPALCRGVWEACNLNVKIQGCQLLLSYVESFRVFGSSDMGEAQHHLLERQLWWFFCSGIIPATSTIPSKSTIDPTLADRLMIQLDKQNQESNCGHKFGFGNKCKKVDCTQNDFSSSSSMETEEDDGSNLSSVNFSCSSEGHPIKQELTFTKYSVYFHLSRLANAEHLDCNLYTLLESISESPQCSVPLRSLCLEIGLEVIQLWYQVCFKKVWKYFKQRKKLQTQSQAQPVSNATPEEAKLLHDQCLFVLSTFNHIHTRLINTLLQNEKVAPKLRLTAERISNIPITKAAKQKCFVHYGTSLGDARYDAKLILQNVQAELYNAYKDWLYCMQTLCNEDNQNKHLTDMYDLCNHICKKYHKRDKIQEEIERLQELRQKEVLISKKEEIDYQILQLERKKHSLTGETKQF